MKNSHELSNDAPELQDGENDFTKMANEMPSFEEHMKQYKEEYPDAVEDINKARAMAEVGNRARDEAALRNDLEVAIQNGDSKKENEIMNQLADRGVEDMMDSLKDYPEDTALQRTQKSFLSALYKTRIGRKISHMTELHDVKQEAKKYDQSEWAKSILDDVEEIEETAGRDHDAEVEQSKAEDEKRRQDFRNLQQGDIAWLRREADLRQRLEEAIQNGDSAQERKILNQIADYKVEATMDALKEYPTDTAFQRLQVSILTAIGKTRFNKKIGHMFMLHETKQEAKEYDQSEWAQSMLETVNKIEENMKQNFENQ